MMTEAVLPRTLLVPAVGPPTPDRARGPARETKGWAYSRAPPWKPATALTRRNAADGERTRDAFEVMNAEVERLDRLVGRLLTLARPSEESGQRSELGALVESRAALWSEQAREKGIALEVLATSASAKLAPVDPDRTVQILDNLIGNAVEAVGASGGRITLEVDRPGDGEVRIAVTDNGPGVSPAVEDRLFEPFFTTREGGTGLGLFLSAELAGSAGGELRYRPRPQGGACFEVSLPC